MEQPVVRHRLAKAGALLKSHWPWIEQFVYHTTELDKAEADVELGGLAALAKMQAGTVLDECARCAILLFGRNGTTTTGRGQIAERIFTDFNRYLSRSATGLIAYARISNPETIVCLS